LFLLLSLGVWHTEPWLQHIRLHAEPDYVREFLEHFGPHDFMGLPLQGQWWVAVYYTLVLVCANIAGEELWWRGYLLPRQELVMDGSRGLFTESFGRHSICFSSGPCGILCACPPPAVLCHSWLNTEETRGRESSVTRLGIVPS
jgi:hypothetical protein